MQKTQESTCDVVEHVTAIDATGVIRSAKAQDEPAGWVWFVYHDLALGFFREVLAETEPATFRRFKAMAKAFATGDNRRDVQWALVDDRRFQRLLTTERWPTRLRCSDP